MRRCTKCNEIVYSSEELCDFCREPVENNHEFVDNTSVLAQSEGDSFSFVLGIGILTIFICWCIAYVGSFVVFFTSDYDELIGKTVISETEWLERKPELMTLTATKGDSDETEEERSDMIGVTAIILGVSQFLGQLPNEPTEIELVWWTMWKENWETYPITFYNLTPQEEVVLKSTSFGEMIDSWESKSLGSVASAAGKSEWARTAPLVLYIGKDEEGRNFVYTTSELWVDYGFPSAPFAEWTGSLSNLNEAFD